MAATVAACSRRPDPAWLTQVYDAKSAAAATADDGVFAYVEATLFGVLCTLADDRFMPVPAMADVQPQWTRGPRGGLFAYEHVLERGGCRWRVLIDRSESPELFAVWEELLRAEQARQKAGS
ncbi:MAG: hypothetical protein KDE27_02700 [Planctomycetes bacterium]|nr:hypothetical protein [Planctomycetota bacterium]